MSRRDPSARFPDLEEVARAYVVSTRQLQRPRRGVSTVARQVAMFVCREVGATAIA